MNGKMRLAFIDSDLLKELSFKAGLAVFLLIMNSLLLVLSCGGRAHILLHRGNHTI